MENNISLGLKLYRQDHNEASTYDKRAPLALEVLVILKYKAGHEYKYP